MFKIDKKTYGCCLIEIIFVVLIIVFGMSFTDIGKEYLVEETGYIHSTSDEEKCHYISIAKDCGSKISRITKSDAIKEEKNICRECYSEDEVKDYIIKLQKTITKNQFIKDWMVWVKMNKYNNSTNFDYLYVYMESSGKLHIKGDCFEKNGELKRIKFSNIHNIESTCKVCVSRSYCDFIYKYINTGKYDISLIDVVE